MADERRHFIEPQPPSDETVDREPAPKPLVTVNLEREVDILTGKGETRRFVKMYFEARDSGLLAALPDELWKMLCVMATYVDENGFCFPSQTKLASDLGISRQAANKRIQRLREFRFHGRPIITAQRERVENRVGGTRWGHNVYQLRPITGFSRAATLQVPENPPEKPMSTQRDIGPLCQPNQTSGEHDSKKTNEYNEPNVNVVQNPSGKRTDQGKPSVSDPHQKQLAAISYPALKKRYDLNDTQCGEVVYLVDLQGRFLGSADRNHRNYIHRAATVVQHALTGLFVSELREFDEQCNRQPPKKGRPQLFHHIWTERQATHLTSRENPAAEVFQAAAKELTARLGSTAPSPTPDDNLDPQEQRRRQYIDQLETKGYELPPDIRRASARDIAAWLDEHPTPTKKPSA